MTSRDESEVSTQMMAYATFDEWFDAGRPERAVYGAPPEFSPNTIAVVHPAATYPWMDFCKWLGVLARRLERDVWVMKLNSRWMVVATEQPRHPTDQWFGTVDRDGVYTLQGAS